VGQSGQVRRNQGGLIFAPFPRFRASTTLLRCINPCGRKSELGQFETANDVRSDDSFSRAAIDRRE
jgi:hypothetical protein